MWMTRVAIHNPVFATMVMVGLVVLGIFSYQRLPIEQLPDVTNPFISIEVAYPGASPAAVENDLTKPLENAVNTVAGIKKIRSISVEGYAALFMEFRLNTDINQAIQEVRDKIAQIRPSFPREAKDPLITRINNENAQPVLTLSILAKDLDLRTLTTYTEQIIVKRLEKSVGVGKVAMWGGATRQIQIQIKPEQLEAYHLGIDQVIRAIQENNQDTPVGLLKNDRQQLMVRIEGKMKTPEAFGQIIVAQPKGAPIYLRQVAEIIDGQKEATSITRMNDQTSIRLDLYKLQDANLIEVGKEIKKVVQQLKKDLPSEIVIKETKDVSEWLEKSLARVKSTIVEGALLTILIVFLFLHSWRSTVITGLTLPIAVITTFIALYSLNFSLNFLTLMALSLCIGLLIDDAIVVRENIVRHLALGKDHQQAALEGTQEIGLAVLATTFAIVAVFVPIAFMSGIIGRYFFQFGVTVTVAVLVSLFVSFTLDPMLSSIWYDPPQNRFRWMPWLNKVMAVFESWIEAWHQFYGRILRWALDHRKTTLLIAIVSFVSSFFLVPFIGSEFIPEVDQGNITLRLNTPIGSSLDYTNAKVKQAEAILKTFKEIELIDTAVGTDDGTNYARVDLQLVDRRKVDRPSQKVIEQSIREGLSNVPGLELSVGWEKPIYVGVLGPDESQLNLLATQVMQKLSAIPGITDLENSMKPGIPAIALRLRPEIASEFGLNPAQVGQALRPLVSGDAVSHWLAQDGQNYDVVVQLPSSARQDPRNLSELNLVSTKIGADGNPILVPIRQIVEFTPTINPLSIKRQDLQRRIGVYANVEGRPTGDVGEEVKAALKGIVVPAGHKLDVGGQTQEMDESFSAALAALGLAVIFIYLILASQFASFLQPIAIMTSLPFSLIGVFGGLLLTKTTLNLFSIIGFIMLMGLVTKNAILLVDFANREQKKGVAQREALLSAGQIRLRPILMTTLAMIFGMLPLAIGLGEGAEQQAPMGRAIIGGIITSTILTLVVVPVIYTYLDSWSQQWRTKRATKLALLKAQAEQQGSH